MTKSLFDVESILLESEFVWHLPKDPHGLAVLRKMCVSRGLWGAAKEMLADPWFANFVARKDEFVKCIPDLLSRGEYYDLLEGMYIYTMYKGAETMNEVFKIAVSARCDTPDESGCQVMQKMIEVGALTICVKALRAHPSLKIKFCKLVNYLICSTAGTLEEQVRQVKRARESGVLEIAEHRFHEPLGICSFYQQIIDHVAHVDERQKNAREEMQLASEMTHASLGGAETVFQ